MRKLLIICQLATVLSLLLLILPQQALCSKTYSLKNIKRRDLLQTPAASTTQCQSQCPSADKAKAACSALSPSQQSSIRNSLISNCGMSSTLSGGCCAAIHGSQFQDYINCACAGDSVLSGLSAFVDASAVVKTCGCSSTSSAVMLSRSDLPAQMTTSGNTSSPPPASDNGKTTPPPPPSAAGGPATNPIATEILSSQGP